MHTLSPPALLLPLLLAMGLAVAVAKDAAGASSRCSFAGEFVFSDEAPGPAELPFCVQHRRATCCNQTHAIRIRRLAAPALTGDLSSRCRELLLALLCVPCDPRAGTGELRRVCAAFCEQLFASCRFDFFAQSEDGARIAPCAGDTSLVCWRVGEAMRGGVQFCNSLGFDSSEDGPLRGESPGSAAERLLQLDTQLRRAIDGVYPDAAAGMAGEPCLDPSAAPPAPRAASSQTSGRTSIARLWALVSTTLRNSPLIYITLLIGMPFAMYGLLAAGAVRLIARRSTEPGAPTASLSTAAPAVDKATLRARLIAAAEARARQQRQQQVASQ